jgi:hypothetical protein
MLRAVLCGHGLTRTCTRGSTILVWLRSLPQPLFPVPHPPYTTPKSSSPTSNGSSAIGGRPFPPSQLAWTVTGRSPFQRPPHRLGSEHLLLSRHLQEWNPTVFPTPPLLDRA